MIKKKCRICHKLLWVKKAHAKKGWGKYCSKKCQGKAQVNGRSIPCEHCGKVVYRTPKDFRRSRSKKFFCSKRCHCIWENRHKRYGPNAPNWISGEKSYKAVLIRAKIIRQCSSCGLKDQRVLVVHHKDRNRKNNGVKNLEWLCMNCHYLEHLKY